MCYEFPATWLPAPKTKEKRNSYFSVNLRTFDLSNAMILARIGSGLFGSYKCELKFMRISVENKVFEKLCFAFFKC